MSLSLPQMAVFIDYENMVLCAREDHTDFSIDPIMEVLRARGRPVLVRAYGDWGAYPQYPRDLRNHAVDLVQLYRYGIQQKNRADIALVVDAMDALFRLSHIEVFVIVAGDGDYAPLASKLREMGKRVVGVGIRGSTSQLLVASCDEFLYYDALVARSGLELAPLDLLDLVEKALRALRQLGETPVTAERLRQVMIGLDPSFVASPLLQQDGSLEAFLEAHPERVHVSVQDGVRRYGLPPAPGRPMADSTVAAPRPRAQNGSTSARGAGASGSRGSMLARYRQALQRQGWTLLNADDRRAVLRAIYEGLAAGPGRPMAAIVDQTASHYEFLGMAITRRQVEEAARAAWRSGLLEPAGEPSHIGGPVVLREATSVDDFVALSERVYLAVLHQASAELDVQAAAQALFGDARRRSDVVELAARLGEPPPLREAIPHPPLRALLGDRAYDLVGAAIEEPPPPSTPISAEEARLLFEKGQEQRGRDFVAGARTLLLASRIQWQAIRQGDFSANADDLRWYVASTLSAEAGARYISREYEAAIPHYLAYFSMLRRGDRLWEDVNRLTIPMLSYYTILATRLEGEPDPLSPNAGQPGYLVALVATHENDRVIWRWQQLATRLAESSPAVFEELMQRIETSSADPETIRRTLDWMREVAQRVRP